MAVKPAELRLDHLGLLDLIWKTSQLSKLFVGPVIHGKRRRRFFLLIPVKGGGKGSLVIVVNQVGVQKAGLVIHEQTLRLFIG